MSEKEERKGDEDGKQQKVCDRKHRKTAKQMVSSPFRKAKKLCRKKQSPADPPGRGCCLCFKCPITSDSAAKAQPEDPNTREFTYEFVKSFIEKNDFYSKECNPHIHLDS